MLKDELSGGAEDTLFVLFWFGPREIGEIPSKAGEAELQGMGFCKRVNFPTPLNGRDNHQTVLTPEGYTYALERYSQ